MALTKTISACYLFLSFIKEVINNEIILNERSLFVCHLVEFNRSPDLGAPIGILAIHPQAFIPSVEESSENPKSLLFFLDPPNVSSSEKEQIFENLKIAENYKDVPNLFRFLFGFKRELYYEGSDIPFENLITPYSTLDSELKMENSTFKNRFWRKLRVGNLWIYFKLQDGVVDSVSVTSNLRNAQNNVGQCYRVPDMFNSSSDYGITNYVDKKEDIPLLQKTFIEIFWEFRSFITLAMDKNSEHFVEKDKPNPSTVESTSSTTSTPSTVESTSSTTSTPSTVERTSSTTSSPSENMESPSKDTTPGIPKKGGFKQWVVNHKFLFALILLFLVVIIFSLVGFLTMRMEKTTIKDSYSYEV